MAIGWWFDGIFQLNSFAKTFQRSQTNSSLDKGKALNRVYGPRQKSSAKNYSYHPKHLRTYKKIPLHLINQMTKTQFELALTSKLTEREKKALKPHLNLILQTAEAYQLDPIWMLSIIRTESSFKTHAVSPKNALGLMQIRPSTAQFIYELQKRPSKSVEDLMLPAENVELGAFYLKRLLYNFKFNFEHAMLAYNLGPNRFRQMLKEKELMDLNQWNYISSVDKNYRFFVSSFYGYYLEHLKWNQYFFGNSLNQNKLSYFSP